MRVLVTGAAGFIGFHLSQRLLKEGIQVYGIDNLNAYYSVDLKKKRLEILEKSKNFSFSKLALEDQQELQNLFKKNQFTHVVNLAAQAGVRYSLENPESYVDSNLVGFANILENCKAAKVKHLIFASSSSVYGLNTKMPFSVHDNVDHPISLYAATKKSNELMAHAYSYLFGLPCTGLRFFTVYGPWGRPDMALFLFTKNIIQDKEITVYNYGKMMRDFTYIDDIVEGVFRVMQKIPEANTSWSGEHPDPSSSPAPYKIYNIGNNNSVELEYFISVLEKALKKKAKKKYLPLQPGDVPNTYADIDDLFHDVGFRPQTSVEQGITNFVAWFMDYFHGG